ncbi:hypothetical protein ACFW81_24105 [Streptomyces angustmyceticus]|uniref:hypothetical protein n=1 Tax=Streptomyces angustmyceticus TaxID=285578 RepID=UPI0036A3EC7F
MLTALIVALTLTAGLAVAWWRMRRALTAVQAERRITDAAVARDHSASVAQLVEGVRRYRAEQAVLAAADAVVTTALAQHAQHRNGDPS